MDFPAAIDPWLPRRRSWSAATNSRCSRSSKKPSGPPIRSSSTSVAPRATTRSGWRDGCRTRGWMRSTSTRRRSGPAASWRPNAASPTACGWGRGSTADDFAAYAGRKTLVLCDIEGAERELLDPEAAPALRGMDLIVESHDCVAAGTTRLLTARFQSTHAITVVVDSGERRLPKVPPWFTRLGHLDQLLATWEWRSGPDAVAGDEKPARNLASREPSYRHPAQPLRGRNANDAECGRPQTELRAALPARRVPRRQEGHHGKAVRRGGLPEGLHRARRRGSPDRAHRLARALRRLPRPGRAARLHRA